MIHTRTIAAVAFAAGIAAGSLGIRSLSAAQGAPAQGATRSMLLTVDMPDIPGKEIRMFVTTLPPGGVAAKHSHPGHLVGYLLEGGLSHRPEGKPQVEFKAGDAWAEHPGEVHVAANASRTVPVKLIAVGVYDKGAPLSTPVP